MIRQELYSQRETALILGVDPRWLDDAPIPRVDIRKAGASRPVWRWRRSVLEGFIEDRTMLPGRVSRAG